MAGHANSEETTSMRTTDVALAAKAMLVEFDTEPFTMAYVLTLGENDTSIDI
jgi:hypothetical protein